MSVVWINGALSAVFGWLAVRDLRAGDVGFVFFAMRRLGQPVAYWLVFSLELVLAVFFGLLAVMAYVNPPECDANGVCTVTFRADMP